MFGRAFEGVGGWKWTRYSSEDGRVVAAPLSVLSLSIIFLKRHYWKLSFVDCRANKYGGMRVPGKTLSSHVGAWFRPCVNQASMVTTRGFCQIVADWHLT